MMKLSRGTLIWIGLVGLTTISVFIGERHLLGAISGYAVVALAALKARWIVLDYMEARDAPGPWRMMFEGWLAAGALVMAIIVAAA
ncbi:cytochrome C oxidase subunit IV family protein [Sphingomonas sp. ID0503]|uniref:cytochrome C oxidase subunit IV family protein n=1 Tax=Sphingomonas sp. ID0503 TaxID=3399691 RepID=UPI003AFABD0B